MFTTLKHIRNVIFQSIFRYFLLLCFPRLSKFATVCRTSRILETAMRTTTMKTKFSVFRLPKDESDKQTSLTAPAK